MKRMRHMRYLLFGLMVVAALLPGASGASELPPAGDTLALPESLPLAEGQVQEVPTEPITGTGDFLPQDMSISEAAAAGPNCRYGVAAFDAADLNWAKNLGAGWYLDFAYKTTAVTGDLQYAQVINIDQAKNGCTYLDSYSTGPAMNDQGLGAAVRANPGALWLVGNEPDRGPNPGLPNCEGPTQNDTMPDMYARVYHDVYHYIKGIDPTARVAIASMVQITPGRLQYLEKAWQAYQRLYGASMPVDVWNMHLYVLPETDPNGNPNTISNVAVGTDPALGMRESGGDPSRCSDPNVYCFAEHDNMDTWTGQVLAMRNWMKAHGQQNKPLIISEYSLLYPFQDYDNADNPTRCFLMDENGKCFTASRVRTFLTNTMDWVENTKDPNLGYALDDNRLVQQVLWFSINYHGAGNVSNLVTNDGSALTTVGTQFRDNLAARPLQINLVPVSAPTVMAKAPSGGTTNVTLSIDIRNSGNTLSKNPFTVTFYADSNLTQVIGSTTVNASLGGCTTQKVTAKTTWTGLSAGHRRFWAHVDSGNATAESNEGDNVISGLVVVNAHQAHLPFVRTD